MAKVSVVMPMYNQEKYIVECLNSVVSQSLKDLEIIVVNDGSTDRSLELVQRFAKNDSRIVIIDKPNTGYGNSMNLGIARATGEYIGIVETDDFIELNMYRDLYNVAKKFGNVDIVKADFCRFSSELGCLSRTVVKLSKNKSYYNRVIKPLEEKEVFRFPMNTWSGIYRTEFLRKFNINHNETPGASYQDNGFWFQTFCMAEKVVFVDHTYYMNRRDNPNSSVYNPAKVYCVCDEYDYISKKLESNPEIKKEISGYYWLKKYHNYIFTLNRIAYMYKREFAERMRDEFTSKNFNEQVDWALYTKKEREDIALLKKDVDLYLDKLNLISINEATVNVIIVKLNHDFTATFNSVVNQSYGKIEIICVGADFSEAEKSLLSKDNRVSVIESKDNICDLVNRAISKATGDFLHIITSGIILNSSLYSMATTRLKNDEVDIYLCASNKRVDDDYVVKDYDNFKDDVLFDGITVAQENKFILFASGVSVANKIFRSKRIQDTGNRLLSFDIEGNSPYFVVKAMQESSKIFIDTNRFIESRNGIGVSYNVKNFLDEYYLLSKLFQNGKLQNSFINLFAAQLMKVLQNDLESFKFLYVNRKILLNILALDKHTRGFYFNGYVYDVLFELFRIIDDVDVAWNRFNKYISCKSLVSINKIEYIDESINNSSVKEIKQQLKKITNEKDALYGKYNSVINSFSFRVGRLITYIPRKFRDYLRPYRENKGFNNKIERQLNKIDSNGKKFLSEKALPLVSIVMPMYNVEPFIDKCLESLKNQTYKNIEIICVDDGSTDKTCEKVRLSAKRDKRIRLYQQNHLYAGVARNEGLNHAKGKYVIFLDSDDYFEKEMIQLMVERAEGANAEITVCRCRGFDNTTNSKIDMSWSVHEKYLPHKAIFAGRDLGQYAFLTFMGWAWDKLYLTEFVTRNKLQFQALRSSNDAYFTFISLMKAKKITFLDKVLVNQRRNIKTSISQTRDVSWNNCLLAADKIYDGLISAKLYKSKIERAFCNWFVQFFCWHYQTVNDVTRELLAESVINYSKKYKIMNRNNKFYYMLGDYNKFCQIIKGKY